MSITSHFEGPDLDEKLRSGKIVRFAGDLYSRQFIVRTLSEFVEKTNEWVESCRDSEDWGCFFRGQNRDYFVKSGRYMSMEPAAFRTDRMHSRVECNHPQLEIEMAKWDNVLADKFGLPTTVDGKRKFRTQIIGWESCMIDRTARGRMYTNLYLVAMLQHYGYPTHVLDVTADPLVALWFALNKPRKNRDGIVTFHPVLQSDNSPQLTPKTLSFFPSVHIFLEQEYLFGGDSCIDLTSVPGISKVAQRPSRQSSYCLPFKYMGMSRSFRIGVLGLQRMHYPRSPYVTLKIMFSPQELLEARPELTQEYLFPPNEHLYVALKKASVPRLVRYS